MSDVLLFDSDAISASDVHFRPGSLFAAYGGKTLTLLMDWFATTPTNVTFANGSKLWIGDGSLATDDGASDHTIANVGAGNDQLIGSAGNDTLAAGAGDDLLVFTGGRDVLDGQEGLDTADFSLFEHAV